MAPLGHVGRGSYRGATVVGAPFAARDSSWHMRRCRVRQVWGLGFLGSLAGVSAGYARGGLNDLGRCGSTAKKHNLDVGGVLHIPA